MAIELVWYHYGTKQAQSIAWLAILKSHRLGHMVHWSRHWVFLFFLIASHYFSRHTANPNDVLFLNRCVATHRL